jgi:VWFA-related protein
MGGLPYNTKRAVWLLTLLCLPLAAQELPDAPVPKNPQAGQFPGDAPTAPKNVRSDDQPPAPSSTPTPSATQQGQGVTTDLAQFGKIVMSTNFVQVPVTVKDSRGQLVPGLGPRDFTIYEDGLPQNLRFFYSGSIPLTAAIVVDTALPSATMKKVNESLPALIGAFTEFDEVALYTYSHTVSQVSSGFAGAANISTATLNKVKRVGSTGGPPQVFGPLASGPTINGHDINDPNAPGITASGAPPPQREFYVLNDAILRAAQDLSRRDRSRRKIIFVVSDGRELGSIASFDEVRKVLLSHNITVYAMGVDTASMPLYDRLGRIRVPGFGTGNILPKYVDATSGQSLEGFDRQSIEQAYSKITDMARNQYTLGYYARATTSTAFRNIEVKVHRANLNVYARPGYYPLPPQPASSNR